MRGRGGRGGQGGSLLSWCDHTLVSRDGVECYVSRCMDNYVDTT
jgi:hypothetical protein